MFNSVDVQKVSKFFIIALIVLSLFLAAQFLHTLKSYALLDRSTPAVNLITISGMGEVFAVPDIASFTFGVRESAATVPEAQKVVTEKIDNALSEIKKAGIEDKDIKTVGYNIYPRYEYNNRPCTQFSCPPSEQKLVGYEVSQTIMVKVRDVQKAGGILGDLGSVDVTDVSGLNFTIDDETALQAEARGKAIADAKAKAEVLAKDLGVKLGKVINFSENGNYPIPYYGYEAYGKGGDMAVSAPAPQIPEGENKIVSNVTITFEIK